MMSDLKTSMGGKDKAAISQVKKKLAREKLRIQARKEMIRWVSKLQDSCSQWQYYNRFQHQWQNDSLPYYIFRSSFQKSQKINENRSSRSHSSWHFENTNCCSGSSSKQKFFVSYFCYKIWNYGNIRWRSIQIIFNLRFYRTIWNWSNSGKWDSSCSCKHTLGW